MEHDVETNLAGEVHEILGITPIEVKGKMKKFPFQFKEQNSGNILTVHHTIKENGKMLRIVLCTCCFDLRASQMVATDRRGTIFVFDFNTKRYWRHAEVFRKPSVVAASRTNENQYIMGSKEGLLVLLDVEKNQFVKCRKISSETINEISFPGQPLQPKNLALLRSGYSALLIDLDTFNCSYRLDFDKILMSLKFSTFLPHSEYIMTCFTNDTLHIWSGVTLEVVRIIYPIRLRDKKLQLQPTTTDEIQEFSLDFPSECEAKDSGVLMNFQNKNLSEGLISSYGYQNDNSSLVLSTWDNYLLIISSYTYELSSLYRLKDFVLLQLAVVAKPNSNLIVGITNNRLIVLLDCENVEFKLIIDLGPARCLAISVDSKYLGISQISGDLKLWSLSHLINVLISQKQCMSILRTAFKQTKPFKIPSTAEEYRFQEELQKLLTPHRLQQILQEYRCYPAKYRSLIWCSLLQLPNNKIQFQDILQMDTPAEVSLRSKRFQLKNATLKRALVKCWSCLAQWCKVLTYNDDVAGLIFPFVKVFQQNPLITFEVCATLIMNQFQLFFEYHPLEPTNYLGLCNNILQHFDESLFVYYQQKDVSSSIFAWSLLRNSFSEVLDEEQWLCLWDNILSAPPYYLIFVVVAYNMMQKEVIIRLPDKNIIEQFFHEQNPIDIKKLITKAYKLLSKCPAYLHPKRYFTHFQPIPKNVYPKFINYPQKCLNKYEEKVDDLQKVQSALDLRMRELEFNELEIVKRLESGLRQEEHTKRMKDVEEYYQTALKREEERVSCQRKMLLLYQKEIRQRKGEVVAALQESAERKMILQNERELHSLQNHIEKERIRNDLNLMWAEDELHNQDIELLAQKSLGKSLTQPLSYRYYEEIKRLCQEQELLSNDLKNICSINDDNEADTKSITSSNYLDDIELKLDRIQEEFFSIRKNKRFQ